ncbi:MAG: hypothetical protein P4L22_04410 [Candidatus Babeliales bacterium]|nr:hypothetical protein [Candidatus Babeliales bacterium]
MKKLLMLSLFAVASLSFNAQASEGTNWKKLGWGASTGIFGTSAALTAPLASLSLMTFPQVLIDGITKPNELIGYFSNISNKKQLFDYASFYLIAFGSVYLAKKSYDKYCEAAKK